MMDTFDWNLLESRAWWHCSPLGNWGVRFHRDLGSISSTFYVRLFCTNVALAAFSSYFWLWWKICTKNARVKHWWNWLLVKWVCVLILVLQGQQFADKLLFRSFDFLLPGHNNLTQVWIKLERKKSPQNKTTTNWVLQYFPQNRKSKMQQHKVDTGCFIQIFLPNSNLLYNQMRYLLHGNVWRDIMNWIIINLQAYKDVICNRCLCHNHCNII